MDELSKYKMLLDMALEQIADMQLEWRREREEKLRCERIIEGLTNTLENERRKVVRLELHNKTQ